MHMTWHAIFRVFLTENEAKCDLIPTRSLYLGTWLQIPCLVRSPKFIKLIYTPELRVFPRPLPNSKFQIPNKEFPTYVLIPVWEPWCLFWGHKVEMPFPVKIRWFALKILSNNHEIIFQDRREGFMKNASCFIFSLPYTKKITIFQSGKFVQPLIHSLDSPYTEYGTMHFHTKHRLNQLPHEYINTWLSLATLGVHALKVEIP
jgi:hypothetical protein